jgi:hypothetical protein
MISVSTSGGVTIPTHIYGVDNIWYYIPDVSFNAFTGA